jgi:flagellar hook-associated protein FlgK
MSAQDFDIQVIRIAELLENIDKVNNQIAMHELHTQDESMIRQYAFHRDTFVQELKQLMQPYHISVQLEAA